MNEWPTWALGHAANFGLNVLIIALVLALFAFALKGIGAALFRLMKK